MKPVIGISGSMLLDKEAIYPSCEMSYVNNDYVNAVIKSGGVPVILPMNCDEQVIRIQVENVDGIILSGGHDVNPLIWGQDPDRNLKDILPARDEFDIKLIKIAMEMKKPILGICRGVQILNAALGGTLYQDIEDEAKTRMKHNQGDFSNVATHGITIEQGSVLYEILGSNAMVNSFHHSAVKELADGLKVAARANDGMIEAVEMNQDCFVMGVQWHPEMLARSHESMQKIFHRFVEEAMDGSN